MCYRVRNIDVEIYKFNALGRIRSARVDNLSRVGRAAYTICNPEMIDIPPSALPHCHWSSVTGLVMSNGVLETRKNMVTSL